MNEELESIQRNGTWEIVDLPRAKMSMKDDRGWQN
jgi:hypothetical protein